jgi:hypothetical protein
MGNKEIIILLRAKVLLNKLKVDKMQKLNNHQLIFNQEDNKVLTKKYIGLQQT